jgi:hypothetical protein
MEQVHQTTVGVQETVKVEDEDVIVVKGQALDLAGKKEQSNEIFL